jgi:hypothetical protein
MPGDFLDQVEFGRAHPCFSDRSVSGGSVVKLRYLLPSWVMLSSSMVKSEAENAIAAEV